MKTGHKNKHAKPENINITDEIGNLTATFRFKFDNLPPTYQNNNEKTFYARECTVDDFIY